MQKREKRERDKSKPAPLNVKGAARAAMGSDHRKTLRKTD